MKYKYMAVALLVVVLVSACGGQATPLPDPTPAPLSGRITFAGSTTVQPLAAELGEAFNGLHSEVTLDIAAGGSGVGIQAVQEGKVDIGMASRALKEDEKEGVTVHQIAVDVIAMVVNDANAVNGLTMEQLRDIYQGNITNWEEVGGEDEEIVVVVRETTSGTRGAFDDIVLDGEDPTGPNLHTAVTAGDVAAKVIEDRNAIGYVGFGNIEEGLKTIQIDDVEPTEEAAQDGSYPLKRPLQLLTGPLTQPLAQHFVDYALSNEGQQVVIANGWIPARRPD